jgi:hypothetical protein
MTARRRGGIPPIVTVLITIAAVVAASLVAWFMWATTRSATNQPIIEVTDAYTDGTNVVFTLRNIGNTQVSISSVTLSCKGYTASSVTFPSNNVPAGGSLSCKATGFPSGVTISDGDSCTAQISFSSPSGGVSVGFRVVKP